VGYGVYGGFALVGHNAVATNENCGKYSSFLGCVHTELHDKVTLVDDCFRGKAYVRRVIHSCNNPRCPVCFKYGWAVREAGKVEQRLAEGAKRFGLVQHIVASVPLKDYGLSYGVLRSKAVKALLARGVVGGVLIFHGFRFDDVKLWYWSPHWHCLGFILGGFHKCRACEFVDDKGSRFRCGGCSGFYGRSKECYKKDFYIVEVMDARKTVGGTAWYQLNHSSVEVAVRRFHVATWFGVCSYRKLKVTPESRKGVCPICGSELERLRYLGRMSFVAQSPREFFDDVFDEDGRAVWVIDERKRNFG
jgi:hypothetical protein